ncbi:Homeobox-leucine zipper protein HOX32 [Platanthera zijinensis]|uniref:Homeobox-leucine zipper protein HOX32 n=1 Tax=Platanthera zijinensis TaxID=2320716 RepID=A0AAP0G1Z1_9ASPA
MFNRKLTSMNKLLMEENDRLQKQLSHLVYDNGRMHQQLQNVSASLYSLLAIAEETLAKFLDKATRTAVKWVQMVGMKPGPDSIGMVSVSHSCSGAAARAYGLVNLEPPKVMEILKDHLTWYRDCRSLDVRTAFTTAKGGNIEFLYMLKVCGKFMTSTGVLTGPTNSNFIRAEMLPSGYLIWACEGGGAMIHIVDHVKLDVSFPR